MSRPVEDADAIAVPPLSALDEHLIHNHPLPVRVMWTSDPRAYERVWFTSQDANGELFLVCGMAFYPNLDTAEAFAIANIGGRHTTVRAHRRLGADRTDMRVGPFSFEVVRPFREWRLSLDENEHPLAFDLRWLDTARIRYRNIGAQAIVANRVFDGVAGYEGFGTQVGSVAVDGRSFAVTTATHCGSRDHHWGTRDGVGGPQWFSGHQHVLSGLFVAFKDWSVWTDQLLPGLDDPRGRHRAARSISYRLRFEPDTRLLLGGEADVVLPNGDTKLLRFERLGHQIAFLRCGMYGGPNGGTPERDVWQGMYVGDDVVTGETYDAADPAVRSRLAGLDQMQCTVECDGEIAVGIVEGYDPLLHDAAAAGRHGITILG